MIATKIGRNDPCNCGSGKKYKHCCQQQSVPRILPRQVTIDERTRRALMEAFGHYQRGQLEEVELTCQRILKAYPSQADAIHLQGLVFQQRGQLDQALAKIERAIELGANDSMHSNRGIVLQALGRFDDAEASYRTALALNDRTSALHCNLGSTLQAMGRWTEAATCFQRAMDLDSKNLAAYNGLGFCLLQTGSYEKAEHCLMKACQIDPGFKEVYINLGSVFWHQGKATAAIEAYRTALAIDPKDLLSLDNLGNSLWAVSDVQEAKEVYSRAYELEPTIARRIRRDLMLPHIISSSEAMLAQRSEFERNLEKLTRSCQPGEEPNVNLFSTSLFNLAFQGMDVLEIQRKVAAFYEHLCPDLLFRADHVDVFAEKMGRLRVGFFSAHVHDHPVTHCYSGLIRSLATELDLDIFLISYRDLPSGNSRNPYQDFKGTFVRVESNYREARRALADLTLDILVYQDIGMDDLSYFLSFARLARVQCVMGGHPVTTGVKSIDYYISSALSEPDEAQRHYSEKLISLNPGPFLYEQPLVPAVMKTREELGLPANGHLYVCPMALQKIHPDFDEAVEAILEKDPQGYVVFFDHPDSGWVHALWRRFRGSISSTVLDRVLFLPWLKSYADFICVNAVADVVIDPFHFGIGSTAIATFAVGTPIVTWPGEFMRGRVGLFYCRLLDLHECVVADRPNYADVAVQIASNTELRRTLSARILANKDRMYGNKDSIAAILEFFRSVGAELGRAQLHPVGGYPPLFAESRC
jgi:predicted O-linked N-acetylglucosamine transferase (SPINDLY family)